MTWLPFSPILTLGFAPRPGNAPGEEWPGVCVAEVEMAPYSDGIDGMDARLTRRMSGGGTMITHCDTLESARESAESSIFLPASDGAA